MAQAKTLTERDQKKVLNWIALNRHSSRNRAIVLTTIYSGMRCKEVSALRIGDVWIEDEGVRSEVLLTAAQTKGDRARTVFLPEKLRKELLAYLAGIDRSDPNRPLFYSQKRAGFDPNTLAQWFHYCYKNAGVSGCSSHSGRRTFITNLAGKGVGVRVLMSLAGHRSISTTQAYIDCNDDMMRRAVELV